MKNEKLFEKIKIPLKYHVVLILGISILLLGIVLLIKKFSTPQSSLGWKSVLLIGTGSIFLYIAFALIRRTFWAFFGTFFFLCGILVMLKNVSLIPFSFIELWPLAAVFSGISLLPASVFKTNRLRTVYLFPAILLIALGSFFLLFSLKILKFSFARFIGQWFPLILIIFGIGLIALFTVQQKNLEILPYMEDDSLIDGDGN